MSVTTNVWHHLRVKLEGSQITLFVDNLTTPLITLTDTNFYRGQIGVRAFQCNAQFDNVTFSNAVPLKLQLNYNSNQLQLAWPQTSVGVKLCSQTNLAMFNYPVIQTNSMVLTNRYWQVNLNPPFPPAQFLWLQSR